MWHSDLFFLASHWKYLSCAYSKFRGYHFESKALRFHSQRQCRTGTIATLIIAGIIVKKRYTAANQDQLTGTCWLAG
jgi:hypothetical protein